MFPPQTGALRLARASSIVGYIVNCSSKRVIFNSLWKMPWHPTIESERPVSARFPDCMYIQDPRDGASTGYSGIRVAMGGYSGGDWVSVAGLMNRTANGERVILSPTVKDGTAGTTPEPVLIQSRSVGGEALNPFTPGFPALPDLRGTHNVGLLISVAGVLTKTESGYWFVDDGCGLRYDPVNVGIPVDASLLSTAKQAEVMSGDHVVVTGICQAGSIEGQTVPIVRLRQDMDIVYYR